MHEARPSPFVSRYVVFQLDKEATVERLKKLEIPAVATLIHAVNDMPIKQYVGYIDKVCWGCNF
jgi:hypothetical protein